MYITEINWFEMFLQKEPNNDIIDVHMPHFILYFTPTFDLQYQKCR